ncbi:MAG: SPFH/Band 7/PHB domain protein [Elusimicrobia bacterium]|nr:SPFH/Band 7/PHB domain protein [Elusimicrobiota bacterium]
MFPSWVVIVGVLLAGFMLEGLVLGFLRFIGFYAVVGEREARVYVLFGNVLGVIDEPGLHLLWFKLGPGALIVNLLGQCHLRDLRLDQEYSRSNPVNSEEGAPMGIGVWYEMSIVDPVAHVFRNADPRGSLRANVSNATVRCLSNLKLADMLVNRHGMSQTVRDEVSDDSKEWGYQVGSVYIRKVHFRDAGMIHQIEEKVVNRLRQVTSAIRQDGSNRVNIIASTAEKEAAAEFARAAAIRSEIVGQELQRLAQDKQVSEVLFKILETQRIMEGDAEITVLPPRSREDLLTQFSVAGTPKDPETN